MSDVGKLTVNCEIKTSWLFKAFTVVGRVLGPTRLLPVTWYAATLCFLCNNGAVKFRVNNGRWQRLFRENEIYFYKTEAPP
ncbi:hypothetical protein D7Z54_14505 [Salibacterium salarium]|uniref:Uncharacterized protein n=1 Tax=Salibacterium salarium TaxID=284579 RepID=A0A3R9Q391_9BACI|nr:hypothetical protein [Salibacterium salarium]RSL32659.1 hypothetical protein D7Z54_14505 [Salibacterium salarium]